MHGNPLAGTPDVIYAGGWHYRWNLTVGHVYWDICLKFDDYCFYFMLSGGCM